MGARKLAGGNVGETCSGDEAVGGDVSGMWQKRELVRGDVEWKTYE